jgi:hypothetical protein
VVGAFDHGALPELDAVLSADYLFDFLVDTPKWSMRPSVDTRADQLELAARVIGITKYYKSRRMDAYGGFVSCGAVEEGIDPEHADSTCQYRLLLVRDFRMRLKRVSHEADSSEFDLNYLHGLQVLHVVRGDAAVCTPSQPADSTHWYLRRWLQDVDALTLRLGKLVGECGGDEAASEPRGAAPPMLALRAIGVPLCPTLKVLCDLPGSEPALLDVYDIQGRRVAQRTVTPQSPGSVLVEAGCGQQFKPGAYWVRLAQGRRAPITRLVMVAR